MVSQASEMLLLNKKITAVEACERSLVTAVFPEDSFHKVTEQRVKAYAKLPRKVIIG